MSTNIGLIIGVFANGFLVPIFGYKRIMIFCYVSMTCFIFITFFAPNVEVLFVGELLCGAPWGIFSALAPAYASEVCPTALRVYLITFVNLCWVVGGWIGSGVLLGLVGNSTQWAYRIPFAVQWAWPVPLCCIVFFAPESPWWLARQGRLQEAEKAVTQLSQDLDQVDAKNTVAMMVHTDDLEREINQGITYRDCFKGVDLRRTEICCMASVSQSLCGFILAGYSTYFFEQVGLSPKNAYKLGLGGSAIAFVGSMLSWIFLKAFGRRSLFAWGLGQMAADMLLIGFISLAPSSNTGSLWVQGVFLLIWSVIYDSTLGPLAFAIFSETPSTRLRSKTVSLARNCFYITQVIKFIRIR